MLDKRLPTSELLLIGRTFAKVWYWSHRYHLSFQFWGTNYNQVRIEKDGVELYISGGNETPGEAMELAIEWCEKSFPKYKYPVGLETTHESF